MENQGTDRVLKIFSNNIHGHPYQQYLALVTHINFLDQQRINIFRGLEDPFQKIDRKAQLACYLLQIGWVISLKKGVIVTVIGFLFSFFIFVLWLSFLYTSSIL